MAELTLPRMDFSSLGQLPELYRKGVNERGVRDAFAGGIGNDPQSLSALATNVGQYNPQLGMSLAQLATSSQNRQEDRARQAERDKITDSRADRQFGATQAYQNSQLAISRQNAANNEDYSPEELNERRMAQLKAAGVDASTPRGQAFLLNGRDDGEAPAPKPIMDDNTASFLADRVLAGDSRALNGLGRGAQGAENIAKIQQLVAQKAKDQGIDASGILTNIAAQHGNSSAFRALGTAETKFGMAEKAAQESFPIALEASAAVPRTQWLAATRLIQKGQTQVNDPNLKKFLIATDTAVKDYARTINPQGVLRESDIEYARKILSTADSPEAYKAAVDQLNTEVGVMHRAIQRQKQELKTGRDPGVGTGRHDAPAAAPKGGVVSFTDYFKQ